MIDIHTHILPGVDDGAQDETEALEMARIAVADGTTHMFATPHHQTFGFRTRQEVAARVARLQARLDQANIALQLIPGHEVRLYEEVLTDWALETAGPLGHSRYVLAEPMFHRYDRQMEAVLFELLARGYIPIMAHPERIRPIQQNLALIEPFLARGGLTQLTANSLTASPDRPARQVAEAMLRNGLAHIIASDAHKPYHRRPILSRARAAAAAIVGEAQAEAMVTTLPQAILRDEPVPASMPVG